MMLTVLFLRLVERLELKVTLTEYDVPKEDIPLIAEYGLHTTDRASPIFKRLVHALESLY